MPLVTPSGQGTKVASIYAEIGADTSKFESGAAGVKSGLLDIAKIATIVTTTVKVMNDAYNAARAGAELDYTRQKFDNLTKSIGTTSDALLHDLRDATRGVYSESDLMASATNLMALGLAKTHDEAVRLATVSGGLNMNMNQLVLTLTNMTTMRFDTLGVSTDGFKDKMKELEKQGYSTDAAFKEAFLQQAEKQLQTVGSAADYAIGNFLRFEAAMKDAQDQGKLTAQQGIAPLIGYLADSTAEINNNRAALKGISEELYNEYSAHKVLTPEMEAMIGQHERGKAMTEAYRQALGETADELMTVAVSAEEAAKAEEELQKHHESLINGAIDITEANRDYQASQDEILQKISDLRAEGEKLYPWEHEKIQENIEALDELGQQYFKNRDDFIKASQDKIAMMAIEKIALQDGVDGYSQSEYELAKAILERTDIATASAFEQQQAMELLSGAVATGQISVQEFGGILDSVMADGVVSVAEVTAALNEIPSEKTITLNVQTNYSAETQAAMQLFAAGEKGYAATPQKKASGGRASGGPVSAGQSYLVGEKGMEMFTPNQNGYITPHDKIATTGGMVVNIMLDSATPDPERVAYNLRPAVERVLRDLGK